MAFGPAGAAERRRPRIDRSDAALSPPSDEEETVARNVPTEVEELLTSKPLMAHLATCDDGRPHAAPVWYRYEDGTVEIATTGRKLANLRANPRAALSVQKDEGGEPR